jgi:transcriptional regulator with XRE-family HTH domain
MSKTKKGSAAMAEQLRLYREANNITQPEMADLLGTGYRNYQTIEKTGYVAKAEIQERITKLISPQDTQITPTRDEEIIALQARAMVSIVTIAGLMAKINGSSIASELSQLNKAEQQEADRLRGAKSF